MTKLTFTHEATYNGLRRIPNRTYSISVPVEKLIARFASNLREQAQGDFFTYELTPNPSEGLGSDVDTVMVETLYQEVEYCCRDAYDEVVGQVEEY